MSFTSLVMNEIDIHHVYLFLKIWNIHINLLSNIQYQVSQAFHEIQ
jgi:hypothetical protein